MAEIQGVLAHGRLPRVQLADGYRTQDTMATDYMKAGYATIDGE